MGVSDSVTYHIRKYKLKKKEDVWEIKEKETYQTEC